MSWRDQGRRVWDLPVRCTHWLLVFALGGSWISAELSTTAFQWHKFFGYTVLVLVSFRLLWGFFGTRHARFASFLRPPRELASYARRLASRASYRPSVGHNPIGGWFVLAMLLLMLAQGLTGLFANDGMMDTGPLFGWISTSVSDSLTTIHHRVFRVLQAIVALHITAVALYLFLRRDNLVLPMRTGRKPDDVVPDGQQIGGSRLWLALIIVMLLAGALSLAVWLAPEGSLSLF
jgi:cytochrome b